MEQDPARTRDTPEVMASIDADGGGKRLIIADVTVNERWLSTPARDGVSLAEWR